MIPKGKLTIRVYGEPRPFPKKKIGFRHDEERGLVPTMINDDARMRRDPVTGKIHKCDRGYKKRWLKQVARSVSACMAMKHLDPFPKNHPIAIGCLFFVTKSKSCQLTYPSQAPDLDNFEYGIWNILKRTARGPHPEGILFYEDDQIVWRLAPSGLLWADYNRPPGVIITVQSVHEISESIQSETNAVLAGEVE